MTPSASAPDPRAARTPQLVTQLLLALVGVGSALLALVGGLVLVGAAEAVLAIFGDALGASDTTPASTVLASIIARGLALLGICLCAAWLVERQPRQGALLSLVVAAVLAWWGLSGFGLLGWVPALLLGSAAGWLLGSLPSRPGLPGRPGTVTREDADHHLVVPRVLVVEHETDDPVAWFGMWLAETGAELDVRRPFAGDALPSDLSGHHAMLVMGGAMGANDDAEHAWLAPVKELYRDAVARDVPALGICLGHQVAAAALGGEVVVNPLGKQVGLYPVGWTEAAADDALFGAVATPRRALQWNDDVVLTLPEEAVRMATAPRGEVQAARFADTVWGVQWHPEVDRDIVARWVHDEGLPDGRDPDAELAELDAARSELDEAWRPLAHRFGELAAAVAVAESSRPPGSDVLGGS